VSPRVILTVAAVAAFVVVDAVTPMGLAIWLLQVVLVWITSLWADRREMIAIATLCSTGILIGFWLSPKTGLVTWIDTANLALALAATWAITHTCLRQRATEAARRKAGEELARSQAAVRVLSGLLPICAGCKKIRDEAGHWEQLEVYIREHSQAEFSHGLCQECMTRLYPDFIRQVS
jgi:cyanate permease